MSVLGREILIYHKVEVLIYHKKTKKKDVFPKLILCVCSTKFIQMN